MIRELYGVHPDHWQIGIDLSGIEARMLAHFCYNFPGGPEFAKLDWKRIKNGMSNPYLVIDGRNFLDRQVVMMAGASL